MPLGNLPFLGDALQRRLQGFKDSRSTAGQVSRGKNVYGGSLPSAPGAGGGPTYSIQPTGPIRPTSKPGVQADPQEQKPFGFSYNEAYAQSIRDLMEQKARAKNQAQTQQRYLREDFNEQKSDLQRQLEEALGQNTNRMATSGLLRSGINVGEQGRLGGEYQEALSDVSDWRSRQQEQIQSGLANYLSGLESQRGRLEKERAREEALRRQQESMRQAQAEANQAHQQRQQELIERLQQLTGPDPARQFGVTQSGGKYYITNPDEKYAYELGGPGSISSAEQLYGTATPGSLEGFKQRGSYFDYLRGQGYEDPRNVIEQILAGIYKDPLTDQYARNPRRIQTAHGRTYQPAYNPMLGPGGNIFS